MLGRRRIRKGAGPDVWQTFVDELTPPYELEKVLSAAVGALASLFPAERYGAYSRDGASAALRLRVTRSAAGIPTVGPDYAGLVQGAPVRPAPLEVSEPGDPEQCIVESRKDETRLFLALGSQVVLTATMPRGRKLSEDERARLLSFSRRARPVMDLVLHIDGLSKRVEAASLGASTNRRAAELALKGDRVVALVCALGAQVVRAQVGFLVTWREGVPKILWETKDGGAVRAFERAASLRELLPPGPGRAAVRGASRLPEGLRSIGIQGLYAFALNRAGFVLGSMRPPSDPERLRQVLPVLLRSVSLAIEAQKTFREGEAYLTTLLAAVDLVDATDPYNDQHSVRVAAVSERLARTMGLDQAHVAAAKLAGRLHDLGMIAVSLDLPLSHGTITDQERQVIRMHPEVGGDLLAPIPPDVLPPLVLEAVVSHHERLDGQGYPKGLSGDAIPLLGRITATAEQYVARLSTRSYRSALTREEALKLMERLRGTQLDPEVVRALLASEKTARLDGARGA